MNETMIPNVSQIDVSGYSEKAIGLLGKISVWIKQKFSFIGLDLSINLLMILIALIVLYFSSKITNKMAKILIWIVSILLLVSGIYQIFGGGA